MTLSGLDIAALAFNIAAYYVFPVVLWVALTRRLGVSWRFVGLGSLTWLSALPFIIGVPLAANAVWGGNDPARQQLVWGVALALTAGVVEETSRYSYYRRNATLRDSGSVRQAIVAGAGHGGTESLVLGIQYVILPLVGLLFFPQMIPADQRATTFSAAYVLINGFGRMLLIVCHIGFTLLVWRAVSQRRPLFYLAAIVLHIALDLLSFALPLLMPGSDWVVWPFVLVLLAWTLVQIRPAFGNRQATPALPNQSAYMAEKSR